MKNLDSPVYFSKKSVHESISQTIKRRGNLNDLAKAFSVLEEIIENAVLLEIEPYRHTAKKKKNHVTGMYQYISAFRDFEYIYPVKITIEKRIKNEKSKLYVIVSVGKIKIQKIKETIPFVGIHSNNEESQPNGAIVSYIVNVPQFIKFFNKKGDRII